MTFPDTTTIASKSGSVNIIGKLELSKPVVHVGAGSSITLTGSFKSSIELDKTKIKVLWLTDQDNGEFDVNGNGIDDFDKDRTFHYRSETIWHDNPNSINSKSIKYTLAMSYEESVQSLEAVMTVLGKCSLELQLVSLSINYSNSLEIALYFRINGAPTK